MIRNQKNIVATIISLSSVLLVACGDNKDGGNSKSDIDKIVEATCSDLRSATSQSEAAQTLSYSMQLAESVGVTNTQLGSLLQSACADAISNAQNLP